AETRQLLDALPVCARHTHAHRQLRLVHVDPGTALDDHVHPHQTAPSTRTPPKRRGGEPGDQESARRAHGTGRGTAGSHVTLRATANGSEQGRRPTPRRRPSLPLAPHPIYIARGCAKLMNAQEVT